MNDKIKELLKNVEESDAIARNKWRIENREQLRKERKEKLKELMEKDKQQTAVEWLEQEMLKPNLSMKEILEQAKEMDKERMIGFTNKYINEELWVNCNAIESDSTVEQYYEKTYGGGNN